MYLADSYFTLTVREQGMVLALSLLLCGLCLIALRPLRPRPRQVQLAGALLIFWAFVWLSPQAYYTLYLSFFDGLPRQIVVGWPPTPLEIAKLLSFQDRATLSEHGKGVLGWILILTALIFPPKTGGKGNRS